FNERHRNATRRREALPIGAYPRRLCRVNSALEVRAECNGDGGRVLHDDGPPCMNSMLFSRREARSMSDTGTFRTTIMIESAERRGEMRVVENALVDTGSE